MTTLREAAQQALEALEEFGTHYEHCPRYPTWARPEMQPPCNCGLDSNVAALRTALAHQPQTPCDIAEDGVCEVIDCCRNPTREEQEPTVRYKCTVVDDRHPNGVTLEQWGNATGRHYSHPPLREWQGLTEEEILPLYSTLPSSHAEMLEFAAAIEAKLKEKNHG